MRVLSIKCSKTGTLAADTGTLAIQNEHRSVTVCIDLSEWDAVLPGGIQTVSIIRKNADDETGYCLIDAIPDSEKKIDWQPSASDTCVGGKLILELAAKCKNGMEARSGQLIMKVEKSLPAGEPRESLAAAAARAGMIELHFTSLEGGSLQGWGDKTDQRIASVDYLNHGNKRQWRGYCEIKPQGTSSLAYPKKNFSLTLFADSNKTIDANPVLIRDWGGQSQYCLKANWIDPTHSCNIVSARLAAEMMRGYSANAASPCHGLIDGYPALVWLDDDCAGLYTLNIPKAAWMFGMDPSNVNHIVMCAEDQLTEGAFRSSATSAGWSIEVGSDTEENIFAKFNRVVSFIKDTAEKADFRANFSQYLDLDACLNYYCFAYLTGATDNLGKNMLMVTYDGQIWAPSLYDLDSLFGVQWDGVKTLPYDASCPKDYQCSNSLLWEKLEAFYMREICERYQLLRNGALSTQNILSSFQSFCEGIPAELYRYDARRWLEIRKMRRSLEQTLSWTQLRGKYVDKMMQSNYDIAVGKPILIYNMESPLVATGQPNDYVDTGLNIFSGNYPAFTILARCEAGAPDGTVFFSAFSERYPEPGYYGLLARQVTDKLDIRVNSSTGICEPSQAQSPSGMWADIAVVRRMDNYKIYLNHNLLVSGNVSNLESITETLLIGAQWDSTGENVFRTGKHTLPFFQVYTGCMDLNEIQTVFDGL